MSGNGYAEFRKKIRGYKNKEMIGVTIGELISIKPVTIKVMYDDEPLPYSRFKSLVNMDNLKEENIGEKYAVAFTTDNQTLFVFGRVRSYEDYCVND